MKSGKKFIAAFLVLVMSLCVLCSAPVSAARVCFTAIDESVLKLTNENMPVWSGGVLYAPYTTFNETDNGTSNWTIQTSYSKNSGKITVFDTRRFLAFDLNTGTCWDELSGVAYSGGAIVRGGRPYLPVGIVCEHFGLSYSYREIEQGDLLRIKTKEVIIPDSRFADAASNILNLRLRDYNQSQGGGNASTSVPSTPSSPSTQTPSTQPPSQNIPPENEQNVDTYLAFRCTDGENLETVLTIMDGAREKGMFFLTEEVIEQHGDLVMRILGSGHGVGLLAHGGDLEQTRVLLEAESKALAEQIFARTTVAFVSKELREQLEMEGWICWSSTLDLSPESTTGANYFSNRVLNQLGNRTRDTYLSLNISLDTVRILPILLQRLDEKGFELELPLETRI